MQHIPGCISPCTSPRSRREACRTAPLHLRLHPRVPYLEALPRHSGRVHGLPGRGRGPLPPGYPADRLAVFPVHWPPGRSIR